VALTSSVLKALSTKVNVAGNLKEVTYT